MVVTGCYAQTASEELEAMPDVDIVIGNNLKSTICEEVMNALELERLAKSLILKPECFLLASLLAMRRLAS